LIFTYPLISGTQSRQLVLAVLLVLYSFFGRVNAGFAQVDEAVLYTSPSVTTPQLPFFAAKAAGALSTLFNFRIEYWKDPESLQTLVLAGKGDFWIGHLEGFARARAKGAPVSLLAVTGWRKFYLISSRSGQLSPQALAGLRIPYTPAGSPSVPVLKAILGGNAGKVDFVAEEPKQLAMKLLSGSYDTALVPEPVVSSILARNQALKIIWSLEDEFAEKFGGKARLPLAGIAVNTKFLAEHTSAIEAFVQALGSSAANLREKPDRVCTLMPAEFSEFVPCQLLQDSLKRDIVHVEKAADVQSEIMRYLSLVAPELSLDSLGKGFIWDSQHHT
jgi:NitT/TauT family transport system substrate-binding protein